VRAICPRNRLAVDTSGGTLEGVIWNIEIENYLIASDAIGNVALHGAIPKPATLINNNVEA
jgi:hypothetical protein